MGIVCPHERHVDRLIGSHEDHVCFDCATEVDGCDCNAPEVEVVEPEPEPEPAPRRRRR